LLEIGYLPVAATPAEFSARIDERDRPSGTGSIQTAISNELMFQLSKEK